MNKYNLILSSDEMTVMDEYVPETRNRVSYQSETDLEKDMINRLQDQGYEYVKIHNITEALKNLRNCLEELNNIKFTDAEWKRILNENILKNGDSIKEKTRIIQENYRFSFVRDDNTTVNLCLIEKKNIYRNKVQVINQYETTGNFDNRYDVTILVNGLPLVHTELKRRGVALVEAFNQINRYQRDSFWSDNGLFEYVQIFIISNGTHTKYYSNTTRFNHVSQQNGKRNAVKTSSNSFEFTNFWADAKNKHIADLVDFTKTFLSKGTLLKILTRYCVFTTEEQLLVMRPYQIVACEKICNKVEFANSYNTFGLVDAGGYIWHTTGSGKTLTSFKTAQLLSSTDYVNKVIFVVDRQDLDYQTMKEYDKFQKGAANGNRNTKILEKQILDPNCKIIVTTIQKLDIFVKQNPNHPTYQLKNVLIFDECHRSQFGDSHDRIRKAFKKGIMFGFTGTPIFAKNSRANQKHPGLRTTEQVFGKMLHSYTVIDAINDKNVLPFRIDYYNTIKSNNGDETLIEAIDDEKVLLADERVEGIVKTILKNFNQKTMRNSSAYNFNSLKNISSVAKGGKEEKVISIRRGFNSIFAVFSINAAKAYYKKFKEIFKKEPNLKKKVALIYSFAPNGVDDFLFDEDSDSTEGLSVDDRTFLENAIHDYNEMFGTSYDTSASSFSNYYKDVSLRMKNGEIDILIVVNMFLTGFDAPTLNTLWVDKNLNMHGLIQAFSRTNRVLNSVKTYGNIVCFRNLRKEVDEALSLFGDKNAKGVVLMKNFNDYYYGYDEMLEENKGIKHHVGYKDKVETLQKKYPLPINIISETEKKNFIILFGSILRLQNILVSFPEFEGKEILTEADMQDYLATYVDLYYEFKNIVAKEDVSSDIVFEMELVKQIVINIDYILNLIEKYRESNNKDKELPVDIKRAINSNPELRPKKELIEKFINYIDDTEDTYVAWKRFKEEEKEKELSKIIAEENLKNEETHALIEKIFRIGQFDIAENEISDILPPMPRFGGGTEKRIQKKERVRELLHKFFLTYCD